MTLEQLQFVRGQFAQGKTAEEIRALLLQNSYTEQQITDLIGAAQAPAAPQAQTYSVPSTMPDVGTLFTESLKYTFSNVPLILGAFVFSLISYLPLFLLEETLMESGSLAVMFISIGLFFVFSLVVNSILYPSIVMVTSSTQRISFGSALQWSLRNIFSVIWASLLVVFVMWGGYMLLWVPGLIVLIYTMFTFQVMINENVRGLNALMRSREIIWGNWWGVFGRFLVLALGMMVLLIPLMIVLGIATVFSPYMPLLIQPLMTAVILVYFMRGVGLMYQSLVAKVPAYGVAAASYPRGGYIALAIIGLIVPLLIGVLMVFLTFALGEAKTAAEDAIAIQSLNILRADAEIYAFDNLNSYEGFCDAAAYADEYEYLSVSCQDTSGAYRISAALSEGGYYCVDSLGNARETNRMPTGLSCQ